MKGNIYIYIYIYIKYVQKAKHSVTRLNESTIVYEEVENSTKPSKHLSNKHGLNAYEIDLANFDGKKAHKFIFGILTLAP